MKYWTFIFDIIILEISLSTITGTGLEAVGLVSKYVASSNQFKYQVSIQKGGQHKCGGTIIDDKFVITVAHCVIDTNSGKIMKGNIIIVAPTINLKNTYEYLIVAEVFAIYIPRSFKPEKLNPDDHHDCNGDIALLQLDRNLRLQRNAKLEKLDISEYRIPLHETLVVSGNGYSRVMIMGNYVTNEVEEIGYFDGKLRYANVTPISDATCAELYNKFDPLISICGNVVKRHRHNYLLGTCTGDDGSPLVYKNTLVGIVCITPLGCLESRQPTIYINVAPFYRFIKHIIEGKITEDMHIATWSKKNFININ